MSLAVLNPQRIVEKTPTIFYTFTSEFFPFRAHGPCRQTCDMVFLEQDSKKRYSITWRWSQSLPSAVYTLFCLHALTSLLGYQLIKMTISWLKTVAIFLQSLFWKPCASLRIRRYIPIFAFVLSVFVDVGHFLYHRFFLFSCFLRSLDSKQWMID